MKEFDFNEEDFGEISKTSGGAFDDGAYITLSTSNLYMEKERGVKKCKGQILIHNDLLNKLNKSANSVMIYFKKGMIAFKFGVDLDHPNAYVLRKMSKHKKMINCGVIKRFEARKFFEKDVLIDLKNKVVAIKVNKLEELNNRELVKSEK